MITMAHVDGDFCEKEQAYMYSFMNHSRVAFTDEQYTKLEEDMVNPKPIEELLPYINHPKYRSQLLYFARLMAAKDGVIDTNEEALLNLIHANAIDGLDMDAIRKDAQKAATYNLNEHDIYIDKIRPNSGLFGVFDRMMLSMGIDLMRD
ncbi:MAG: hypothetical protein AB8B83_05795 [Bdellovibrionales bacterium]